jgi:peptidoglycan hydrolase-like protein with peptidoglycan-binding domain
VQGDSAGQQAQQNDQDASHADIIQAQEALNAHGFKVGHPEGRLGPRMHKEIMAFQKARHLLATCNLDSATKLALNQQ